MAFNDFSPRLGITYNVTGDGRTLARANYARYFGQVGNGGVAATVNPVGSTTLRYPWIDANRNQVADVGEITLSANPRSASTNWSAANPARTVSANSVDPNLKNDTTDEFILGLDREVGRGFAVGGSYIYRKYSNFSWSDRAGHHLCGLGRRRPSRRRAAPATTVSESRPAIARRSRSSRRRSSSRRSSTLTNVPDYYRGYNGFELTGRKRLANHWMMNTSFAYNATKVNYGSFPGGQPSIAAATITEDPSNRESREGYEYDYLTAGSGIGNVYVNSKWLFKVSGLYELPFAFNVSAFYNARQGYPQEISVQTPACSATVTTGCRGNGSGQIDVLLNPVGETRLPNFQNLDFHVERPIRIQNVHVRPVAGRLQRQQRRHHPGDSQPPERHQRQPDPGDRGAARAALRHQGELVRGSTGSEDPVATCRLPH